MKRGWLLRRGNSGRRKRPAPGFDAIRKHLLGASLALVALPAAAQDQDRTLIYRDNGLTLRWHLQAGINAVSESNLFWNFANTVAPGSGYKSDKSWLETYVKPGLSFEQSLQGGSVLYGKVSAVSSYTVGTDAYETGDTGRTTLEEAYVGFRTGDPETLMFDLSIGARELKLGTGMVIANGGSSGFERGALKFGPRKAWERAAIARLNRTDAKSS